MRTAMVFLAGVIAAVLIGGGLIWLTSSPEPAAPGPQAGPDPEAAPPPAPGPDCSPHWGSAGFGAPVPVSDCYGPREQHDGLASGFEQSRMGAVYAATHLYTRLSSASGPQVYMPTLANQTIGDYQTALSETQQEQGSASPAETTPAHWWYRVSGGDPASGLVTVDLAGDTPQAQAMGGYAGATVTLRWDGGDWKAQLPRPQPQLVSSLAGYQPLGPEGGGS